MRSHVTLYLLSDSTGETVHSVARAAMAQFTSIQVEEAHFSLLRSVSQLDKVLEHIAASPGPVMYTLVRKDMRNTIRRFCDQHHLPCISILGNAITQLSAYLGLATMAEPGRQHELDDTYFIKVEAVNFALAHDDGQNSHNLDAADIILVGPSRTSKSPTCMHLAQRGYRAANVPYVQDCALPPSLFEVTTPYIIGLTINVERLADIRQARLSLLGQHDNGRYADMEAITQEVQSANALFRRQGWPVLDVTRRSVEETAAYIVQMMQHRGGAGAYGRA